MMEADSPQPHHIGTADFEKYSETFSFVDKSVIAPLQNAVRSLGQRNTSYGEALILCGEAGSGKSSVVYYLAHTNKVPVFTLRSGLLAVKSTSNFATTLRRSLQYIISTNITCVILFPDLHNMVSSSLPDAPAIMKILLQFLEYLSSPPHSAFPVPSLAQILFVGCTHTASMLPPMLLTKMQLLTLLPPSTRQRKQILHHIQNTANVSARSVEELEYAADKYGGLTLVPCIISYKMMLGSSDPILPRAAAVTVHGHQHAINAIIDAIQLPRKYPQLYRRFSITPPTALLLYGLPGTGKTLLARQVAVNTGGCFVNIRLSDVLRGVVGAAEMRLREIFASARRDAPAVLFIDEFQAMFTNRNSTEHAGHTLTATLTGCLDDVAQWNAHAGAESLITVIAATNEPWLIDDAFLRGGRFDKCILVGPLDEQGRKEFLIAELRHKGMFPDVTDSILDEIVHQTINYTGADLSLLLQKAVEFALDGIDDIESVTSLEWMNLEAALQVCTASCSEDDLRRYDEWSKRHSLNG